jgi:hypothetical protein
MAAHMRKIASKRWSFWPGAGGGAEVAVSDMKLFPSEARIETEFMGGTGIIADRRAEVDGKASRAAINNRSPATASIAQATLLAPELHQK